MTHAVTAHSERSSATVTRVSLRRGPDQLTRRALFAGLGEPAIAAALGAALRSAPFTAFYWETPPLCAATAERPFECVLVDAPVLARMTPQPAAFAEHYVDGAAVAVFHNLGGDALLVAPRPDGPAADGVHLAAFVRTAPADRQLELWRAVGEAATRRLGRRPLWVSTCGTGVAWLHVRLDDRPKYYAWEPYRDPAC